MKPPGQGSARRQRLVEALRSAAEHFNGGRWPDAEAQARLALSWAPGEATALNLLASSVMESKRPDEAIPLFKRAVAAEPKSPFLRFNLGEAYRRSGAYASALPCFERAAALKPDFAEAIALAGECLQLIGREDEAERHFHKALRLAPDLPTALHGLGSLQLQRAAPAAAAGNFSRALAALPPGHSLRPSLLANLGRAFLQTGDGIAGFEALSQALEMRSDDAGLWRLLATSLRHTKVVPLGEPFRRILLELFDRSDVNPRDLATAALALLAGNEQIAQLLNQIEENPGEVQTILESGAGVATELVSDPLFRKLVASAPVPSTAVELLLVQLRSDLLALVETVPERRSGERDLAICLAHQSFLNEHVQYVDPDDEARLDRLIADLDQDDLGERAGDATGVAIVAACRPLIHTPLAKRLGAKPWPELSEILREQLDEPAQEAVIRAQLSILKPPTDATSLAVQEQYEESPYPRWTRCSILEPLPFRAAIRVGLPHLLQSEVPDIADPRILVAGCGTGLEMMRVVTSYKSASVLAVDLSASSLAYAARKVREYQVSNVTFMQADILDLGLLDERFDLVESFGVIHHMADPAAGLAALAGLLTPKGLLSIGLYSAIGRRAIVEARAHIDRAGYPVSLEGVRSLRRHLMLKERPDLAPVMSPASDFWTTSDCRDLLFHVNEHRFTLLQVSEMLRTVGLTFLGVEFSHGLDRARFLSEHESLAAVQDVTALHRYELAHPEVFGDTYRVWARRC
jgi:tetratricopeptide (TPR) repeat protein/SAM-dependent methyltransferase